ncbi:MAG: DUF2383 domain-containing protein [Hyphomicrobiaceae bacterium]|nr:DUF2383 domain-containing protein [Hyphomicrobiaceae bacterium]
MSRSTREIDTLKTLHTALIDSRNGYEEALTQAEGGDHIILFQELIAAHQTSTVEIEQRVAALGETPDISGSFMSTINRTMMDVRALFTGLGDAVLPALISSEKRNIELYDAALKVSGADYAPILSANRESLIELIGKMERLQARAAA